MLKMWGFLINYLLIFSMGFVLVGKGLMARLQKGWAWLGLLHLPSGWCWKGPFLGNSGRGARECMCLCLYECLSIGSLLEPTEACWFEAPDSGDGRSLACGDCS